ncbi:MAG: Lrp/AsnC family transcriptional regulator [Ignavibacteria bacterium]|nr:Lrp/AsnC family transcriptional regulator [Ignavibacteria bacterium]
MPDNIPVPRETDRQICALLQDDARLSLSEIAERVGLSVPTVSDHVKRMETEGVILEYVAVINPIMFGFDVTAFIYVDMESSSHYDAFRRQCRMRKEVLECHATTGTATHLIKVRVKNTQLLEQLLSAIQQWKGVTRTTTSVVLSTHKETFSIQL